MTRGARSKEYSQLGEQAAEHLFILVLVYVIVGSTFWVSPQQERQSDDPTKQVDCCLQHRVLSNC